MTHSSSSRVPRFQVLVGDGDLNFREVVIPDPIVTGRQLLDAAGARPVDEHLVIAVLPDGALETLRQDELFDLTGRGAEKVLIFRTDRSFRFKVDDRDREWGPSVISGLALKALAGIDAATHDVYQEIRGKDDLLIRNTDLVDLSKPGVEKFFTAIAQTTEGRTLFLPPRDAEYLAARGIAYEDGSDAGQAGVILKDFPLPPEKFSSDKGDILIILPPGYPDSPPDMFYCSPWLTLRSSGAEPRAASVQHSFRGEVWQRWSRHNTAWRPGVDGIQTMVKRIERALSEAA
ncbi:multiubiquitin domain-containing protein [Aureimonas ureilytica]|uniref:multiubiquitin domain-containing protein n=1 Tax=Aureimonas ureilytica TaxID=401562 RepID=UPI0003688FF1|nr:multiubiquitin domain-containing protein [Aureimonas ureilytica]